MSMLLWMCLGLWLALNGLIAVCLVRRGGRTESVQHVPFQVFSQGSTTPG